MYSLNVIDSPSEEELESRPKARTEQIGWQCGALDEVNDRPFRQGRGQRSNGQRGK